MNLYLLERDGCGWDEHKAFVIQAADEHQARRLAHDAAYSGEKHHWLDPSAVTCRMFGINAEDKPEIILADFHAG